MALFPPDLYILSARDLQLAYLTPVLAQVTAPPLNAISNGVAYTVPMSACLLLQKVVVYGLPVIPAVSVARQNIYLIPPDPAPMGSATLVWERGVQAGMGGTGGFHNEVNFNGLAIPEGWRISCGVAFDVAALNVVSISVFGITVPMGNIERV